MTEPELKNTIAASVANKLRQRLLDVRRRDDWGNRLKDLVGRQAYLIKHCWDDPAARREHDEIEREIRGDDEPEAA